MAEHTNRGLRHYNFHIKGEKGTYQVAFSIDEDNIESSCDCDYNSEKKLCWHRYYILAGKTQRLPKDELRLQTSLISNLSATQGGRELISHSKAVFGEKETCRRCNKNDVVDLKKGLLGKFIKLFLPAGRRYFCWSCRWSW